MENVGIVALAFRRQRRNNPSIATIGTHMKINFVLAAAILASITALSPSDASAAPCDTHKTKFMWRRCMSAEVAKLADAIGQKALDLCNSKTNSANGPAAVDERLACRIEKLSQTLQQMN